MDGLRRRLARGLGHSVSDALWRELERQQWLTDGEADQRFDTFVEEARALQETLDRYLIEHGRGAPVFGRWTQVGEQRADAEPVDEVRVLDPQVAERARLRSAYLARLAGGEQIVRRFRAEVLADSLLSDEEARCFVRSPAAALFPIGLFHQWGVPLGQHTAEVTETRDEGGDRVTVRIGAWVDPPGTMRETSWTVPKGARSPGGQLLEFPGEEMVGRVRVGPGAILEDLRRLSEDLATRYDWHPYQATWFVLTGQIPFCSPIRSGTSISFHQSHARTMVRLEVAPWVPIEDVVQEYQRLRKSTRQQRPLSSRTLALAAYVGECIDDEGRLPNARGMQETWNRQYPEWRYADLRNFRRLAREAFNRVFFEEAPEPTPLR
jgi:hypothetical protein